MNGKTLPAALADIFQTRNYNNPPMKTPEQKLSEELAAPSWRLDPRIQLAAERTLLAWLRTGLALIGFGFVVARYGLFLAELAAAGKPSSGGNTGSVIMGISLVALGVWVIITAANRYRRYSNSLSAGEVLAPPGSYFGLVVAGFLAVLGVIIIINLAVIGN
jgi:putative membrane protein